MAGVVVAAAAVVYGRRSAVAAVAAAVGRAGIVAPGLARLADAIHAVVAIVDRLIDLNAASDAPALEKSAVAAAAAAVVIVVAANSSAARCTVSGVGVVF